MGDSLSAAARARSSVDRATDFGSVGRGFESLRARQTTTGLVDVGGIHSTTISTVAWTSPTLLLYKPGGPRKASASAKPRNRRVAPAGAR